MGHQRLSSTTLGRSDLRWEAGLTRSGGSIRLGPGPDTPKCSSGEGRVHSWCVGDVQQKLFGINIRPHNGASQPSEGHSGHVNPNSVFLLSNTCGVPCLPIRSHSRFMAEPTSAWLSF